VRGGLLLSSGLARAAPIARRMALEGHLDPDVERDVDWAHGAFLLVRREAWDTVGGFDAGQWLYAEDLDLCWRLRREGWRTRYVATARVEHAISAATSSRWDEDERALRTQRAAYAWLLHRRGAAYTRAVALAHLAGPSVRARLLREGWRREREQRYVAMHRTGLESRVALEGYRRGE
jgi:N-acetylglucosaminyl-diphospho-decaprenol L-rhamnosyltransferase